jgi:hypothetical protein
MDKNELREWLGILSADILVWGAVIALGAVYLVKSMAIDILLSVLAIGLMTFSCFIGMKHDDRLSKLADLIKKILYPASVLFCAVVIYPKFTRWNVGYSTVNLI